MFESRLEGYCKCVHLFYDAAKYKDTTQKTIAYK